MTYLEVVALMQLAKRATVGPWRALAMPPTYETDSVIMGPEDDGRATGLARVYDDADARYIAALSPERVEPLLAIALAALKWRDVETTPPQPSSTGVGDWSERREAARDALLAAVEASR